MYYICNIYITFRQKCTEMHRNVQKTSENMGDQMLDMVSVPQRGAPRPSTNSSSRYLLRRTGKIEGFGWHICPPEQAANENRGTLKDGGFDVPGEVPLIDDRPGGPEALGGVKVLGVEHPVIASNVVKILPASHTQMTSTGPVRIGLVELRRGEPVGLRLLADAADVALDAVAEAVAQAAVGLDPLLLLRGVRHGGALPDARMAGAGGGRSEWIYMLDLKSDQFPHPPVLACASMLRGAAKVAAAVGVVGTGTWVATAPPDALPHRAGVRQRCVIAQATLTPHAAAADARTATAGAAGTAAASGSGSAERPALLLTGSQVEEACALVDSGGICVVEKVLSADAIRWLDSAAAVQWTAGRGQPLYGRVHADLMAAPEKEHAEKLCAELLPLVESFFSDDSATARSRPRADETNPNGVRRWYLSQLQFVDAMPGCTSQFWHVDNTKRGLTILLPLVETTEGNGPTELFPASHLIWKGSAVDGPAASAGSALGGMLSGMMSAASPQDRGPVRATVGAGAAIIYDSRTMHRGRANVTGQRRPALVLRYDLLATPPPGIGVAGTTAVRVAGQLAERICGS